MLDAALWLKKSIGIQLIIVDVYAEFLTHPNTDIIAFQRYNDWGKR